MRASRSGSAGPLDDAIPQIPHTGGHSNERLRQNAAMRLEELGATGLRVSRVGLGCNNFGRRLDLEGTRGVVDAALEAGITFFDTADIYGGGNSERFLGEILAGRRDEVVLATKFGMGAERGGPAPGSREYLRAAFSRSLERLQTDHVDLLYYHTPDERTPIGETVAAMEELRAEGSIRAIGVSNFDARQLEEAVVAAPVAAVQNEYNLLEREAEEEVLPRCRELGVSFIPYFPLASGLLTGKYRRGEPAPAGSRLEGRRERLTDEVFDRVEALEDFAAQRGHSLLELATAALASQPGVASVIAGATSPEQVRANAAAAEWELSEDDLAALARL
jgi:aryl-alcohol dehydrogenase-like predicted oxidoreductase